MFNPERIKMKILYLLLFLIPSIAFCEISSYHCNFTNYCNQEGIHKVKNKFELTYIVDDKTDKSYPIGNNGSSEVTKIESGTQISFIEVTPSGNINTTTIDSKFNSVHSRNVIIAGELIPAQYYGTYEIK